MKMKMYEVLNPFTNETEIIITDAAGIANVVKYGFDVVRVEEVEG